MAHRSPLKSLSLPESKYKHKVVDKTMWVLSTVRSLYLRLGFSLRAGNTGPLTLKSPR